MYARRQLQALVRRPALRSIRRARIQPTIANVTGTKATTSAATVQSFIAVNGNAALKPSGCSRARRMIRITVWPAGENNHPTKTSTTQATDIPNSADRDRREKFIEGRLTDRA